jgi:RES domain-containing protein
VLTAWRVIKTKLTESAFDGEGARLFGGRWNSPGTPIIYTSESLSLAVLEILVHLQVGQALSSYSACAVRFDGRLLTELGAAKLPGNWRESPAQVALQQIGDDWVATGKSVVLKVPSAIVDGESNYLLNPRHPDFESLVIEPFGPLAIDSRLHR